MPAATPAPATPSLVAIRHPRSWPLAFGDYLTGGVIHQVDPATAERLLARGFERVPDPPARTAPTDPDTPLPAGTTTAPADPAPPAPED